MCATKVHISREYYVGVSSESGRKIMNFGKPFDVDDHLLSLGSRPFEQKFVSPTFKCFNCFQVNTSDDNFYLETRFVTVLFLQKVRSVAKTKNTKALFLKIYV